MRSDPPTRCTATTTRGQPCKRWAVRGSDPPRCAAHGGAARKGDAAPGSGRRGTDDAQARPDPLRRGSPGVGDGRSGPPPEGPEAPPVPKAPPGLTVLPGLEAPPVPEAPTGLEAQIEDLDRRIADLGAYIDEHQAELDPVDLVRLLNLHSTMVGRVSRVRAIRQQMTGGDGTAVDRAMDRARDDVAKDWGVEL